MACAKCPYTNAYELIWQDAADPAVICVLLRCCAGPELQIRRGPDVLRSELHPTKDAVLERAEMLKSSPHFSPLSEGHQ
jgi:hypothetical protein